jgi:ubiquitin carboxyl-terminal hydrolase 22/27/51
MSCNCIIHSTFAGQYQSDVECEKCHNVTSTVDPLLGDINLELRDKGGEVLQGDNTLGACLRRLFFFFGLGQLTDGRDRFTSPEKLGKEYTCVKCKASHVQWILIRQRK